MKKSKLLSITFASTAVLVSSAVVPALCINTTVNNKNVKTNTVKSVSNAGYEPLTIKEDCLNANTIVSDGSFKAAWAAANAVDRKSDSINSEILKDSESETTLCTWYTKDCVSDTTAKEHAMNAPDDKHNLTIDSTSTSGLSWIVPNVGKDKEATNYKNNSIKIWYNKDDLTTSTKNITFTSTQCGSTLFFLASAANLSDDSAKLNVTCNYSVGDSESYSFTINDWNKTTPGFEAAVFWRSLGRGQKDTTQQEGYKINYHGIDEAKSDYHLSQCSVKLDPKRVLKDVTISCESTTTKGNPNNMVFTVYGVSCLTNDLSAPKDLKAGETTTKTGATLSWTASESETAKGYKLDIATDADFLNYVEGFKDIQIANSKDTTSYTISSGLEPNKTYYARIRSFNAAEAQSPHSNVVSFTTKDTDATKIEVKDLVNKVALGEAHSFATNVIGETFDGKTYNPQDQKIIFDLTEEQSKYITATFDEAKKTSQVKIDKCVKDERVKFHSEATSKIENYVDLTVAPKKVSKPVASNQTDKTFDLSWTKLDEATQYEVVASKNEDLSNPVFTKIVDIPSATVNGLEQHTKYWFAVTAIANGVKGEQSEKDHITTEYTKIPTPSVSKADWNKTTLSWSEIHDAKSYKLIAYTLNEKGEKQHLVEEGLDIGNVTSYNLDISKLKTGTKVYFQVKAVFNDGQESEYSEIKEYTINKSLPAWAIALIAVGSAGIVATAIGVPLGIKNKKKKEEDKK